MRTWFSSLALAFLLLGCGPPLPEPVALTPPLTDKEQEAILTLQMAINLSDDQGEDIWPGYHLAEVPILIFRPGARSFLMMAQPQLVPAWATPIAFDGLDLPTWVLPSARIQTSPRTPFSQDFPLGDLKVFLVRHDNSTSPESFFRLAVHERFHAYQSSAFKRGSPPETCRFPYEDMEHAALIRAEEKQLTQILTENDDDKFTEAVVTYFAIRRARYLTTGGLKARGIETWEETTEGTARYVEEMYAMAAGYSDPAKARRALVSYFDSFDPKSLQKWRYYRTGLAIAMGLDLLVEEEWKLACVEGSCLFDFVLEHLGNLLDKVSAQTIASHTTLSRQEFDSVRNKLTAYLGEEQKYLDTRKSQGAYRVSLSLEAPSHGYYSARGVTFALQDCSRMVTGVTAYVDRGFGLEVRNRSIRMVNRPGFTMLEFYHDLTGGEIRIDGQPWNRQEGEHPFSKSLEIRLPDFEIRLSGCGLWKVASDAVFLSLQGLPNSPKCP